MTPRSEWTQAEQNDCRLASLRRLDQIRDAVRVSPPLNDAETYGSADAFLTAAARHHCDLRGVSVPPMRLIAAMVEAAENGLLSALGRGRKTYLRVDPETCPHSLPRPHFRIFSGKDSDDGPALDPDDAPGSDDRPDRAGHDDVPE